MAQERFAEFASKGSFNLNKHLIKMIPSGIYAGFDFAPDNTMVMKFNNNSTGYDQVQQDLTNIKTAVIRTKQGVVVQESAPLPTISIANNNDSSVRYDAIVCAHRYVNNLAGGVPAQYVAKQNVGSNDLSVVAATLENDELLLGILTLPANCTSLSQIGVAYKRVNTPGFNGTLDVNLVLQQIADLQTYVNNRLNGLTWKQPVKTATTSNITLSGTQTIDTIAVIAEDRVLVKDQTTLTENGIYIVKSGAWVRSDDANSADELLSATVFIGQGTVNKDIVFTQITDNIVLGMSNIVFVQTNTYVIDDANVSTSKTYSSAKIEQMQTTENWQTFTSFSTGSSANSNGSLQYRKVGKEVFLRGSFNYNSGPTNAFVLPNAHRPQIDTYCQAFRIAGSNAPNLGSGGGGLSIPILITTNGTVFMCEGGTNITVFVDTVRFRID